MENKTDSYRPVSRPVNIGSKEYAVLDPEVSTQRAASYLKQAKDSIKQVKTEGIKKDIVSKITQNLLTATDYGCAESPFLLAHIILDQELPVDFLQEDAILFLKIAAERRHSEACQQMASCYAGNNNFRKIVDAGEKYFAEISDKDRQFLAEYYFEQADKFATPI